MEITIKNFKAIDTETTIKTNSINIITGQNSAGKSSITQAIRLLKENLVVGDDGKWNTESLAKLNLNKLNLGRFNNVITHNAKEPNFSYRIKVADYNEFFINNHEFLVDLVYKQSEQEEVAELTEYRITTCSDTFEDTIIEINLMDTANPDIFINYDYIIQYFSNISLKGKLAIAFNKLAKEHLLQFGPTFGGVNKKDHPDFISQLQDIFPELPNIEEVVDMSPYEQSGYHNLKYEGGQIQFSVLRPFTEFELSEKKGYTTIGQYPLCEFLQDKPDLPVCKILDENKIIAPIIPEELVDMLINKTRNEIITLFQEREKNIITQALSKSFFKNPNIWYVKFCITKEDILLYDTLDEYVFNILDAGNQFREFIYSFNYTRTKGSVIALTDYINHLIRNVMSYISVELDLFDYFNGTNIEVNRTYSFNSSTPALLLINKVRHWLTSKDDDRVIFVKKWIKEFDLADDVRIDLNDWGDSLQVLLLRNNKWLNIATEGTGKAKLLFLILKIADSFNYDIVKAPDFYIGDLDEVKHGYTIPKLLIIEEPEAFLHPNFQSKLADMFFDASGYIKSSDPNVLPDEVHTAFVIETHSEYLIRKFQYLVAKSYNPVKLARHISIYYVNDPKSISIAEKRINILGITSNGSLKGEFGSGFFDEASSWKVELLRIKHAQKN